MTIQPSKDTTNTNQNNRKQKAQSQILPNPFWMLEVSVTKRLLLREHNSCHIVTSRIGWRRSKLQTALPSTKNLPRPTLHIALFVVFLKLMTATMTIYYSKGWSSLQFARSCLHSDHGEKNRNPELWHWHSIDLLLNINQSVNHQILIAIVNRISKTQINFERRIRWKFS